MDINTVAPVVAFHGTKGLILLGVKYAYFSNSISPMSFLAGNVGIATVIPFFQTNMLSRVYYSLLASTPTTSSALGASKSLLNYEAGFDMKLFGTPMLVGYQGETMFLSSGNFTRQYNMFFVSCSLM
ncbi:hypothetical protein A2246_01795 [candidate division WOR-1 bacterium RIFOXYA2_FULL_37_7]|nr:MAG: hypothetical protein A2246_01795 [candidate division WOR-1 bacterium RIFOXYA2_FULL_37_7]